MDNLAIELKNVYEKSAKAMQLLQEKYVNTQNIMKSNASYEEKIELAESFDMNYEELNKACKEVDESIAKIGTAEERSSLIKNNDEIKKEYISYLWFKEEAEYMYPHAKGAVSVFLRDEVQER